MRPWRAEAAKALGNPSDPANAPPLEPALKDAQPAVRLQAALSWARLGNAAGGETAYEGLKDADSANRQQAANVIALVGDAARGLKSRFMMPRRPRRI